MTELSLKRISDIFSFTSLDEKTVSGGISAFDCTQNIALDGEGRAYFYFADKKGKSLSLEEIKITNTPLETAVARVRQQQASTFSWEKEGDANIYFDKFPEFADALFQEGAKLLFNGTEEVKVAKDGENARLKLKIEKGEKYRLSFLLKTDAEEIENPVLLSAVYVIANKKIYRTRDMGVYYKYLSAFEGEVRKDEINLFLTLFASLFPAIDFIYSGFKKVRRAPITAKPALAFQDLDNEGNLSIKMLMTSDDFPMDFISQNKPTTLVKLNEEKRVIEKTELVYDTAGGWKKILSMIRATMDKHPEARDEDGETFALDGDTLFVTSTIALPFLSENLGDLVQYYALFGTEALRRYNLHKSTPATKLLIKSGIDFFDTECEIRVDNDVFTPRDFVALYEKNNFIPLSDGSRAIVDKTFFSRLKRLLGKQSSDGKYKLSFFDLPLVDSLINAKVEGDGGKSWKDFYTGFNSLSDNTLPDIPIVKKLRDYQLYGVKWLFYLMKNKLGGCLADDMGLGKTIQTVALLSCFYADKHKSSSIIIVPKSLIDNWRNEIAKFAPDLDTIEYYGTDRSLDEALKHTIILTTYAVVRNDIEELSKHIFDYAVLDEVHQIKNAQSQASKAVMLLNANHRLAISGTPMENNLGELYSIFRFLNPTMLGSSAEFTRKYGNPVQKENDEDAAKELSAKIRPFILRRLKQDVAKELPERTESVMYVDMTEDQARLYEAQRIFYKKIIEGEIEKKGFEKSQFSILQGLLELRQIATVPETKSDGRIESAKWDTLLETIEELSESGHRCLVFSNFLSSLEAVSARLEREGIDYLLMTGATSNRQELVARFQSDENYKVFLMTLKTGGVGLTLTGADYVFILDPWWNRSAEQQAIDRTHRIGQTRNVFCYRLIARNTIEEKILELQQKKKDMFDAIISSDSQDIKKLTQEDIDYLLRG